MASAMLGALNRPFPQPAKNSRQARSAGAHDSSSGTSNARPTVNTTAPTAAVRREPHQSPRKPPTGPITAMPAGKARNGAGGGHRRAQLALQEVWGDEEDDSNRRRGRSECEVRSPFAGRA